jgi:pyruvate, orthophosphate dikinase
MTLLWLGEHPDLDRELVGGKAHSLNRMHLSGLPVPPAFVLSTDTCALFDAGGGELPVDVVADLKDAVSELERRSQRRFGDPERPLLVSVRSGAARSMPGMMDTILNLGANAAVADGLRTQTGNPMYAADTLRRFVDQFERVVGAAPPEDPWQQLLAAVGAVFRSWNSPRAQSYRRHHGIGDDGGTAVTVQAMVFGNFDDQSGSGVLFTRNPSTGDQAPFGEWLPLGQGEDVVSGRHDPLPLHTLAQQLPEVHAELLTAARTLEITGKDVQEVEFTVESGRLWLLQTRAAKRSPDAAVRFAVSLHQDGIVTIEEALRLVTPEQLAALRRPTIAPGARAKATLLARGEPACPGTARGTVVLDTEEAEDLAGQGVDVVLARPTADPHDVAGMIAAVAILTEVGGSTSHAAVVSRELSTPCVLGCGVGTLQALAGRQVTVDGETGEVFDGALEVAVGTETANQALSTLNSWLAGRGSLVDQAPAEGQPQRGEVVDELKVLQAVRLKGRIGLAALAATVDVDSASVGTVVTQLAEAGFLFAGKVIKVSPEGRQRLTELLAEERGSGVDKGAIAAVYDDFRGVNADFKALITDWQLKNGEPNTHDDTAYDARVLTRLDDVHNRVTPLIAAAAVHLTRLACYSAKLSAALAKVHAGERIWLTRPIIDSYHTVWFELHEELILAAGLTREDEARAGHAQ